MQIPYKIIDLDKVSIVKNFKSDTLQYMLAISCLIEGSESNILLFYKLYLEPSTNVAYISECG